MTEILMPELAQGMVEGTIIAWLVADGQEVKVGDELAEIETDKASVVYSSEVAGCLSRLHQEGATVPVGTPIAELLNAVESVSEAPSSDPIVPDRADDAAANGQTPASHPPAQTTADAPRIRVSPLARRIAVQHTVDLSTITGTGPRGRIVRVDIDTAIARSTQASVGPDHAAPAPSRSASRRIAMSRAQQTVARRMSEARAVIPEFHVGARVDMQACLDLRAELRAAGIEDSLPSLNDLIVMAVATALPKHPRANSRYVGDALEVAQAVNVGIAIASGDELFVPVVADANRKTLRTIARESRQLAEKARNGKLSPADVSGGTFTISNLGMHGIETFQAIINPPQVAILAVGAIVETVVPQATGPVTRPLMNLTLTCDHRALYGVHAAALLSDIRSHLEHPIACLA
jgi:pyruvate dehydrogenase E2 component (dihydrolipoamide acetyltransferase)